MPPATVATNATTEETTFKVERISILGNTKVKDRVVKQHVRNRSEAVLKS